MKTDKSKFCQFNCEKSYYPFFYNIFISTFILYLLKYMPYINFEYYFKCDIIFLVIFLFTIMNNKNEFIINKSKFITLIFNINNKEDIDNILAKTKEEYIGANHYVYAYIVDTISYSTDDKEPSGTAGKPILNVLEKNNLNHVLCIVVRYFGGIKLGAGPLTRAYSRCASEIIKLSNIIELEKGYLIKLTTDLKSINNLPKIKMDIIKKDFNNDVNYTIEINEQNLNILKNSNIGKIEIIKEIEVKK